MTQDILSGCLCRYYISTNIIVNLNSILILKQELGQVVKLFIIYFVIEIELILKYWNKFTWIWFKNCANFIYVITVYDCLKKISNQWILIYSGFLID